MSCCFTCLYLLLLAISVTQVFGECKVCGSKGSDDKEAEFCKNSCAADDNDCDLEINEKSCLWDKTKPVNERCVNAEDTSKLCYFQDLENDSLEDNECSRVAKCTKSRKMCEQCTPCDDDKHSDGTTTALTSCYLARKGDNDQCVFNYVEDGEIKVDHCEAPDEFVTVCVPGTPGDDMEYIYVEISEGATWEEALEYCLTHFNAFLATIIYEADMQTALEYVGFGAEPWTGMRSTDPDLAFSPVDGTVCPVWHHGHPCSGCTEQSLWENGLIMPVEEGGSQCVRIIPEEATLTNDVDCDDKLYAVLCNCENTAE